MDRCSPLQEVALNPLNWHLFELKKPNAKVPSIAELQASQQLQATSVKLKWYTQSCLDFGKMLICSLFLTDPTQTPYDSRSHNLPILWAPESNSLGNSAWSSFSNPHMAQGQET